MQELQNYTAYIEKKISEISFPESPKDLYSPIEYILGIGGKRVRPILTLLATEMFGQDKESSISQALAIEVFHNFTLIHDDIMDEAPLRRNQPTVHHKWNINTGILSGDVMMIQAYDLLSQIDPAKLVDALRLFNKTAIEVCEGQQLDMDFENRQDVSIHEYLEMIRLKTSVLLGCALELGAIVSNASESDRSDIYNFGQHIGIAFQIQDDILDLYADASKFGKQVGGDVIANKKTLLYLTAVEKANQEQKEVLKQLASLDNLTLKVDRTRSLFDQLNVKADCQQKMEEHYSLAMDYLSRVNVSDDKKSNLVGLSKFLMQREN